MKILKELTVIIAILFMANAVKEAAKLPIPSAVLGMLFLLLCLLFGIVKLKAIEKISGFLLNNITILFVPGGVGLITSIGLVKDQWFQMLLVAILATIIGISVTGLTVQFMQRVKKRRLNNDIS
ncbi:MAG: CidA/LrgA family protein [Clostridiales bacterium]|nr:CidA/LrgA family protein [Clostridiales bacterium]